MYTIDFDRAVKKLLRNGKNRIRFALKNLKKYCWISKNILVPESVILNH